LLQGTSESFVFHIKGRIQAERFGNTAFTIIFGTKEEEITRG
jgi:hypothetical protein